LIKNANKIAREKHTIEVTGPQRRMIYDDLLQKKEYRSL